LFEYRQIDCLLINFRGGAYKALWKEGIKYLGQNLCPGYVLGNW